MISFTKKTFVAILVGACVAPISHAADQFKLSQDYVRYDKPNEDACNNPHIQYFMGQNIHQFPSQYIPKKFCSEPLNLVWEGIMRENYQLFNTGLVIKYEPPYDTVGAPQVEGIATQRIAGEVGIIDFAIAGSNRFRRINDRSSELIYASLLSDLVKDFQAKKCTCIRLTTNPTYITEHPKYAQILGDQGFVKTNHDEWHYEWKATASTQASTQPKLTSSWKRYALWTGAAATAVLGLYAWNKVAPQHFSWLSSWFTKAQSTNIR